MELALGRSPHIAINHDYEAITMHAANHPDTFHYTEDVFHVDPYFATAGRRVQLMWASPDCKTFSRAKGAKPVEKKIRMLAWVIVKWAKMVHPDIIMLENVSEFQEWGPLTVLRNKRGKPILDKLGKEQLVPIPKRKGEIFQRWWKNLEDLGYKLEKRVLNAADYGVPTSRKRLFVIARRDGKPIVWPQPTHCKPDKDGRVPEGMLPWRTAAECIDWELPCPSIFLTRRQAAAIAKKYHVRCNRPLAYKTMWRMANGLVRYVIKANKPFIVRIGHFSEKSGEGGTFRGQGVDQPMSTICSINDKGIASPVVTKYYSTGGQDQAVDQPLGTVVEKARFALNPAFLVKPNHGSDHMRGGPVDQPLHTITQHRGSAVVSPYLTQVGHRDDDKPGRDVTLPLNTILSKEHHQVVAPVLVQHSTGWAQSHSLEEPLGTICASGQKHSVVAPLMAQLGQTGGNGKYSRGVDEPVGTIVSKNQEMVVEASLHAGCIVGAGGSEYAGTPRPVDAPLNTIKTENHQAVVAPLMVRHRFGETGATPVDAPAQTICAQGKHLSVAQASLKAPFVMVNNTNNRPKSVEEPLPTVTTGDRHFQAAAHLTQMYGQSVGQPPDQPMPTQTAIPHTGVIAAHVTKLRGDSEGSDAHEPLPTITSGQGAERPAGAAHAMGVAAAHVTKFYGGVVGSDPRDPLSTVTAVDHNGLVTATLDQRLLIEDPAKFKEYLEQYVDKETQRGFWRVHRFLKKYLGKKAPLPVVMVDGFIQLIVDVGMRMLKPRELLNAQFTPELAANYKLTGSTANQVAKIGNSVCPLMAKVLVEANVPKSEISAA